MAKTQATRSSFISSIINILRKYDLDGIDIDWEYPARRDGLPEDRENFVLLLKVSYLFVYISHILILISIDL